jgi:hypothetical protein
MYNCFIVGVFCPFPLAGSNPALFDAQLKCGANAAPPFDTDLPSPLFGISSMKIVKGCFQVVMG